MPNVRAVFRFLFLLVAPLLFYLAFLTGCVSIPEELQLAYNGASREACDPASYETPGQSGALDPERIVVATWNIYKGKLDGWQEDLDRLYRLSDILLLQEAHLAPRFLKWIFRSRPEWVMAHAFTYRNYWTGVFTAAKVPQITPCAQRYREPYLRLPKTVLVSYFPI